jgi:hypothetical protein
MCILYYGEVMETWNFSHVDIYYIPLNVTFPSIATFLTIMF